MNPLFADIIGQSAAKKKLGFFIESYYHTKTIPHFCLCGAKGNGKTKIAKSLGETLARFKEGKLDEVDGKIQRKPFYELNCSGLKNLESFVEGFLVPHICDKDVTVFFDESCQIPKDITMALLTILNPNPTNKTTFSFRDSVCDFDFSRQSFIFATSEPHMMYHALLDRLERIDLEDYTTGDMAEIVRKSLPEVSFTPEVLIEIGLVLRGNARAAVKTAKNIHYYLKGETIFGLEQWREFKNVLGILPLGLSQTELLILQFLFTSGPMTLTCLASKTGLTRSSLQQDFETFLQRLGLMIVEIGGRKITQKGIQYLAALKDNV